jgi:acylphosphatase
MAKLVYYSGDVQGVGFRAKAVAIARRHPVRGWVKNLPDGRVEIFADGVPEAVALFLAEVRNQMRGFIDTEDTEERDSDPKLEGFRIWY